MQVINTTKMVYKTLYKAADGKIFENEKECLEHEKNAAAILEAWKAVPKLEYTEESLHLGGGYSDIHYIVYCRNQDDVDAANAYIEECAGCTKERFTEKSIGKRIVITVWNIDNSEFGDDVLFFGEPTDVLKDMADLLYAPITQPEGYVNER